MITEPLIAIALCIVLYGAFSAQLSKSIISAPMLFMLVGLLVGQAGLGLINIDIENEVLEGFGELTLGFILFADAASTNSRKLALDYRIPRRLLLVSLPLTMLFGTLVAIGLFPNLSWQEAALIAAILAPTDAALGYAVVTSEHVPERIRQGILVESGLNDGLALPAVLFFAALAFSAMQGEAQGLSYWLGFTAKQIIIGGVFGIVAGAALGKAVHYADGKGWISHEFRNLTCIGVAILILLGAELAGGNGFIAAFVGGLVFGSFCKERTGSMTSFVEEEGQLFSLIIFFFFGAVLLPSALEYFTAVCILYALLSLTVIRIVPTVVSLIGLKLSLPSSLFMGWFGPRGLASILFLLIAVEHEEMGRLTEIEAVVYVTVFLSVILHGASAAPLSKLYGNSKAAQADGAVTPAS
ncbi:MAG: sodium:proton antiporter [Hyphococcus sp.]|nr:MAG: sodium:proton antiporter [Marinicaulis sp.]